MTMASFDHHPDCLFEVDNEDGSRTSVFELDDPNLEIGHEIILTQQPDSSYYFEVTGTRWNSVESFTRLFEDIRSNLRK